MTVTKDRSKFKEYADQLVEQDVRILCSNGKWQGILKYDGENTYYLDLEDLDMISFFQIESVTGINLEDKCILLLN